MSDKRLDSPQLGHFVNTVQLTFRHNFNLEASDLDPNLGFDGGVLEVSFDGNTFQDILDEGGTFVKGGYNRVISTDRGSPIAGRQAWSGNSGGFITTMVSLGTISLEMRFRWRMASDNSGSSEGWRVDTVNMSGCEPMSCETPTPTPTPRHLDVFQLQGLAPRRCLGRPSELPPTMSYKNRMLLAVCLSELCLASLSVSANTITVTNTNDSGPNSLRQALANANDGDTINFAVTGTIGLTSGELLVTKSVTISGPGTATLTVDGNATSRVFHIGPGKTVSISGLT